MEVVSMAAEIYASAAGTIAQIWILSELFPRKQSVKKVYKSCFEIRRNLPDL